MNRRGEKLLRNLSWRFTRFLWLLCTASTTYCGSRVRNACFHRRRYTGLSMSKVSFSFLGNDSAADRGSKDDAFYPSQ